MPVRKDHRDRLYFSADAPMVACCIECRGPMVKAGLLDDGIQRIICTPCRVRLQVSYSRMRVRKTSKGRLAAYLLGAGKSIREVARMSGISKKTVNDIRKDVMRNSDVLCGCGQEAGHNGWCSFRYDRSPARQAFMARMGRPPKEISIEIINLLREQGKTWSEVALLLGVNRNTINRRRAEYKSMGRTAPWFCIGTMSTRTAIAIRRYYLMFEPVPGVATGEDWQKAMNELWKAARDLGCPSCGVVRKQSNGTCRRCLTIRRAIQQVEWAVAGTIRQWIAGHWRICAAPQSARNRPG